MRKWRIPLVVFVVALVALPVGMQLVSASGQGAKQRHHTRQTAHHLKSVASQGITLSYVPDGFKSGDSDTLTDSSNPSWSVDEALYTGPGASFMVMLIRGVPTLDVSAEIEQNPGATKVDVNGVTGVLIPSSEPGTLAIVEWMLDSKTEAKVAGRWTPTSTSLDSNEVLKIANGVGG